MSALGKFQGPFKTVSRVIKKSFKMHFQDFKFHEGFKDLSWKFQVFNKSLKLL